LSDGLFHRLIVYKFYQLRDLSDMLAKTTVLEDRLSAHNCTWSVSKGPFESLEGLQFLATKNMTVPLSIH